MNLSYTVAVSNFTSGSFHSPATARAQRLLPQPWTPRMMTPFGGSRAKWRACASQEFRRCASQVFRLSRPPPLDMVSVESTDAHIHERVRDAFLAVRHSVMDW